MPLSADVQNSPADAPPARAFAAWEWELALRYLRHTQLPLSQVANMLGYHELSAFSRSCQRWFGAAPGQLRRSREAAES